MAQENQEKIYSIKLDISQLNQEAASLNEILKRQDEQLKQLKKNGEQGSAAYAKLQTSQRKVKSELRDTNKQIDNQNKLNQAAEGSNDALRAKLALLTKQYNGLGKQQRDSTKEGKAMQKEIRSLSDELKANESAVGDNRRNVGNYKDALSSVGGPMAGFVSGMGAMTKAAVAFIATPIGLVIAAIAGALAALRAAFTSSEEGQNKFARIMSQINAILGNGMDLLADLGEKMIWAFENPVEAIQNIGQLIRDNITNRVEGMIELIPKLGEAISLVLDGEFSAAGKVAVDAVAKVGLGVEDVTDKIDKAADAVANFVDENIKEAEAAGRVADMRAEADVIERNLLIKRAELESRIAELRLKAREEDKFTAQERKAFLTEALDLQDNLLQEEKKFLVLRRDAQILENTFSRTNKENKMLEAEAIAAVNAKEAERYNQARTIQREVIRTDREIQRDKDTAAKEEEKRLLDLAAIRDEIHKSEMSKHDLELQKVDEKYDKMFQRAQELQLSEEELRELEMELIDAHEKEISDLREKHRQDDIKAANDALSKKKQIMANEQDAAFNTAQGIADASAGLAEDSIATQKAAGVTSATISTYKGAASALEPPPTGAGPLLGPILMAATIATGLAQVANILSAERGGVVKKLGRGGFGGASYMGIIGGRSHSEGGTKFYGEDGSLFEAEKGELIAVVNKKNTALLSQLNAWNTIGGNGDSFFQRGGTFLQNGGFAARSEMIGIDDTIVNGIRQAISDLPPGQIEVVEISNGLRNAELVETIANLR